MNRKYANYLKKSSEILISSAWGFRNNFLVFQIELDPNLSKDPEAQLRAATIYLTTNFNRENVDYGWARIYSSSDSNPHLTYFIILKNDESSVELINKLLERGSRAGTWANAELVKVIDSSLYSLVKCIPTYGEAIQAIVNALIAAELSSDKNSVEMTFSVKNLPPVATKLAS